jgi:uncharacterized membrane protein SpoIIM required for sporulation
VSAARDAFVAGSLPRWRELEQLLPAGRSLTALPPSDIGRVAALYRSLCADLSRARSLGCAQDVLDHLDALAARSHNLLYARTSRRRVRLGRLLLADFPRALRASRLFLAVSAAAFLLPMAFGLAATLASEDFAASVVPPEQLERLTEAYAEGFATGRAGGDDVAMAGFYVYNNVGISFRCFATGILFGLGSLFYLVYNGLLLGTVTAWVGSHGAGLNLVTFICGHGPFELTAIVISGAAGLRMGWALVETRGMSRLASLRAEAPALVALVGGVAAMLVVAAVIEGFWSPSSLPMQVKWAFAATMSFAVASFLIMAGRDHGPWPDARASTP